MAYDRKEEMADFSCVCEILKQIHSVKSASYGDSWKKRGELVSIFGNVARKFDRIENLASDPEKFMQAVRGNTNELVEETILDMAVYGVLWCTFISEERPENFSRAVKAALGEGDSHVKER